LALGPFFVITSPTFRFETKTQQKTMIRATVLLCVIITATSFIIIDDDPDASAATKVYFNAEEACEECFASYTKRLVNPNCVCMARPDPPPGPIVPSLIEKKPKNKKNLGIRRRRAERRAARRAARRATSKATIKATSKVTRRAGEIATEAVEMEADGTQVGKDPHSFFCVQNVGGSKYMGINDGCRCGNAGVVTCDLIYEQNEP